MHLNQDQEASEVMVDKRILKDKNFINKQCINTLRDMYFHCLHTYQHRTAIVYKECAYTFQAVEAESNKFRSAFEIVLDEKMGPVVVNIYNCPELIFIVVALIKLGLPIVLVDPSFPRDRVATICESCSASLLVTWNKTDNDKIKVMTAKELLSYKSAKKPRKTYHLSNDDIAYIVYTSGSTGIPKGIAIPHRAICNYLDFAYRHYKVTVKSHFALCTSISFDLTLTSLLLPICFGCNLHIIDNKFSQLISIQEAFGNERLTHLKLTPSHLKILSNLNVPEYTSMKYIIVGGEAFSSLLAHSIYIKFNKKVNIINEYGPSETTIGISSHLYSSADDKIYFVPIGKPIQQTTFYLDLKKDDTNRELLVAGEGLALGYWQDPRLTAIKFVPCTASFAKRVYKTGDLVERDQRSLWHYHGRVDNQIKLNGFRIDLGEIESAAVMWGKADSCVVSVYDLVEKKHFPRVPKRIKLCVYIKINNFSQQHKAELRNFLAERLPHYMLPEYIMPITVIPLTINGKIDYEALPKPNNTCQEAAERELTTKEKLIAKIWAESLNIEQEVIYANSDFFSIGGDSITAIYVMQKCAEHEIDIDVRCLLENPILADFVSLIERDNSIKSNKNELAAQMQFKLSPVQEEYLNKANNINDFSQAVLIKLEDINPATETLKNIIYSVVDSYDVFKYKLSVNRSDVYKLSKLPVLIECLNINSNVTAAQIDAEISKAFAKISLDNHVYIYCLIISDHKNSYLIFVVHHLLIDAVSFQLILDHIDSLIRADKVYVDLKQNYYQWLTNIDKDEILMLGRPYWEHRLKKYNAKQRARIVTHYSDISIFTKGLDKAGLVIQKNIEAMLLTAFIHAYGKIFAIDNEVFLSFEKSGRRLASKFIDPSALIGWLSSYNPMLITGLSNKSIVQLYFEVLFEVANMPEIPFGCYSYLDADKSLTCYQFPNIVFNYLGKIDRDSSRCFSVKPIMSNYGNSNTQVLSAFEIILYQAKDSLYLHINYNNKIYRSEKIKQFVEMFQDVFIKINSIITYRQAVYVYDYKIRDFDYYDTRLLKQLNYSFANIEKLVLANPQQLDLFLFAEYFSQAKNAYYQELNLKFSGTYNLNTMGAALQRLVSEFEVFRTIFVELDNYLVYNVILREPLVLITVNNKCILGENIGFGVNIKKGPLAIFNLVQISGQQFELTLKYHHIVMDGWSLINLFKRFFVILSAVSNSQLIENCPNLIQSDVYNQYLNTAIRDESLNYWQDLLTQFQSGTFKLPTIAHTEKNKNTAHEIFKFTLSEKQTEQFTYILNRHHISPSILMHAMLAIILFKYYGLSTLCFGTIISGRESGINNMENMVGLFSRTIPVVISIDKCLAIEELFVTINQQINSSAKHSALSLGEMQRSVLKNGSLFDVLLVVENYPFASNVESLLENYNISFKLDNIKFLENTHYPLTITFYPGESLAIDVQFNTDIFPIEFISEFKTHVSSVLTQIYEVNSLNVYFATLYNHMYEQRYLDDYTCGPQRKLANINIVDYFYQQLTIHLHRVAVVQENKSYSYAYIDKHSDKLASYLYSKGFAAGSCIGILLGRHVDRVITWLAVLKLGAHYLPLDINLSKDRLEFMLQDSAADVVVTHSRYKELLSTNDILNYDELKIDKNYKELQVLFNSSVCPKSLFNIIYTSGSSGKPKGVMVTYGSILNYFLWMRKYLNLTARDKMVQILSFSFDPAVTEMFVLLTGGTLLFLPDAKQLDLVSLERVANNYQATIAQMVPSIFNAILLGSIVLPNSLKHIICGAEKLEKKYVAKLYQTYRHITIHNLYGLTETTIDSTSYHCPRQIAHENIPIGRPFINQRVLILDKALQLVPIGLSGNIYLGGCGVSLGYIAQPRKTAEKFIPDPFAVGERMYNTGDLGLFHYDGNIEFIGRLDRQVKLRGVRIELDEVESIIKSNPEIVDAAVIVKVIGSQKQLYVFYVADKIISDHAIRKWLLDKHSNVLTPTYIINLKNIPKTYNNKNDYKALANLNLATCIQSCNEFAASKTEEQLASILAAILEVNVSAIDIGVGFFDLGLDSILLMRFHAEICKKISEQVTMNHLFMHATVSSLAKFIDNQSGSDMGKNIVSTARKRKQLAVQARQNRQRMKKK